MDHQQGHSSSWWCGPGASCQEPVFAARVADSAEGEGYLLAILNLLNEHRSALVVLDARHIDQGPLATVHIPLRLRPGLHGSWVPRSQLPMT
jgi:carotenoid cleavage dioxygenase-like enzyme